MVLGAGSARDVGLGFQKLGSVAERSKAFPLASDLGKAGMGNWQCSPACGFAAGPDTADMRGWQRFLVVDFAVEAGTLGTL